MEQKGKARAAAAASRPLLWSMRFLCPKPATAGCLNLSGTTKADGHLAAFHQHRYPAIARSEAFHLFHGLGTGDDILIDNGQSFFTLGLPGLNGIGSGLLAEDGNLLGHLPPPQDKFRK